MSDRRPSKLYVEHEDCGGSATLAEHDPRCDGYTCHSTCPIPVPCECRCGHVEVDPIAVVRRGVESGQIEGWFKRWCVKHDCEGLGNADRGEIGCTGAGVGRAVDMDCRLVPVLMIEEQL